MTEAREPEVVANLKRAHESLPAARTLVEADLFVKAGKLDPELGRELSWLFELRLVGDYGETRHVAEPEARRALQAAGRLVEELEALAQPRPPGWHEGRDWPLRTDVPAALSDPCAVVRIVLDNSGRDRRSGGTLRRLRAGGGGRR